MLRAELEARVLIPDSLANALTFQQKPYSPQLCQGARLHKATVRTGLRKNSSGCVQFRIELADRSSYVLKLKRAGEI